MYIGNMLLAWLLYRMPYVDADRPLRNCSESCRFCGFCGGRSDIKTESFIDLRLKVKLLRKERGIMIGYEEIKSNEDIRTYIKRADESLVALGYTEHSFAHVTRVAETAGRVLEELCFDGHTAELARIAGFLHDIGNLVNRSEHSQSGAVMAFRILDKLGMEASDIATIVTAIGNHDEGTGLPVNAVAAALILADKSDVRRSRVRNTDITSFDIHDRVNYSVDKSELIIDRLEKEARLVIELDSTFSAIMDYFEIFLERMILCRKAADSLGLRFHLYINGQVLI